MLFWQGCKHVPSRAVHNLKEGLCKPYLWVRAPQRAQDAKGYLGLVARPSSSAVRQGGTSASQTCTWIPWQIGHLGIPVSLAAHEQHCSFALHTAAGTPWSLCRHSCCSKDSSIGTGEANNRGLAFTAYQQCRHFLQQSAQHLCS